MDRASVASLTTKQTGCPTSKRSRMQGYGSVVATKALEVLICLCGVLGDPATSEATPSAFATSHPSRAPVLSLSVSSRQPATEAAIRNQRTTSAGLCGSALHAVVLPKYSTDGYMDLPGVLESCSGQRKSTTNSESKRWGSPQ